MAGLGEQIARQQRTMGPLLVAAVVIGLIGLPVAAWLDLRDLSERMLRTQASEISRIIDEMRGFYGSEVVGRVLQADDAVTATHNYRDVPGAIPIPATLSIELGKRISAHDGSVKYRFVSDLPFKGRDPHQLDAFERNAIFALRANPREPIIEVSGSLFDRHVRAAAPVVMGQVCVTCHNSHPDSPKTDWKVGDVRGIQEISVNQPIAANVLAFKYLLLYFGFAAAAGLTFILLQRRQSALVQGINKELSEANDFLAAISLKIAKYLSPQIYKSIFSGQKDVTIATERKKLTIFFSDVKDFTAIVERLQPEDLTVLLNEYFTEMSTIALKHGATVDKFIGDALLVFFGDPETQGVEEDARACLRMAVDMQRRLEQLNRVWRDRGVERPFQARMGINTGYCNVGNFGSDDRMDYTIIGAEANLAARLQSIAEPGGICLSYETYALVRDLVRARPLAPIAMKGISREVVPYEVEGLLGELAQRPQVISEHATGLDLFLDVEAIDENGVERAKKRLSEALLALTIRSKPAAS
ncbi:MAG: adenylate/guanylate cyclase domain-containing protein [Mesorhizobium sp.]|uniref:adenylate/guanylate cyclase domain-containing protein n=3 Tax=unclassified Mesorhizobium TaxID=325217 RepID=UPI000FD22DAD|nr:adenylate/guanylate cyclase domain-containing protein [Mesorhizobium sp.]RUV91691.1 adenylate/guanylate cyclase domain-containing protein [Mesorhizobium sp. M5C.F.Ca.IN.020.14.1.1]RWC47121.1 MAG: adenylate/guanylate cyclase domain-containing protein [Mesorhizobium sp.]RWD51193.1 MAG: adenylate/guanylate cyclase domain-containing protein [Mesorhizobium sp.]RWE12722.1 MAG: adenylate/guanylate cyclase domain-containing protein [Mesorhizobium sp.]RWE60117.1 MAG: adenylate/guanylate cyclase doma